MKLAAAVLAIAASVAPATAQDAWTSDAFAGYSMLKSGDDTWNGWHAALHRGLSGRFGLVLDLSGHQGTSTDGTDVSALSLMAGPRLTLSSGRVRPFAQVIGGLVRSKAGITVSGVDISETSSDFGGAFGGGVDVGFGARWAVRGAADYRVVKTDADTTRDPRFSVGLVCRFGH